MRGKPTYLIDGINRIGLIAHYYARALVTTLWSFNVLILLPIRFFMYTGSAFICPFILPQTELLPSMIFWMSILHSLLGVFTLIGSFVLIDRYLSIRYQLLRFYPNPYGYTSPVAPIFPLFSFLVFFSLIISIMDFIVSYGLLKMRQWSAMVGVAIAGIGIVINFAFLFLNVSIPYPGGLVGGYSSMISPSIMFNIILIVGIVTVWKYYKH